MARSCRYRQSGIAGISQSGAFNMGGAAIIHGNDIKYPTISPPTHATKQVDGDASNFELNDPFDSGSISV
jgi:hypothetical protein